MHVLQGSISETFFFLFWDSAVVLKALVSFVDMHIGTFS